MCDSSNLCQYSRFPYSWTMSKSEQCLNFTQKSMFTLYWTWFSYSITFRFVHGVYNMCAQRVVQNAWHSMWYREHDIEAVRNIYDTEGGTKHMTPVGGLKYIMETHKLKAVCTLHVCLIAKVPCCEFGINHWTETNESVKYDYVCLIIFSLWL